METGTSGPDLRKKVGGTVSLVDERVADSG
jgi:hypothetical protein